MPRWPKSAGGRLHPALALGDLPSGPNQFTWDSARAVWEALAENIGAIVAVAVTRMSDVWLPPATDSFWICSCGAVNAYPSTSCHKCG